MPHLCRLFSLIMAILYDCLAQKLTLITEQTFEHEIQSRELGQTKRWYINLFIFYMIVAKCLSNAGHENPDFS